MATELAVGYVTMIPSAQGFGKKLAAELGRAESGAKSSGDSAGKSFIGGFASAAKAGALAAGAIVAGVVGKGFADAISFEAANDKLAAQLGASGQYAEDLGKIAGNLYADAYGDSLGQVNDALRGVLQNGLLSEDASDAEIEAITAKALDLATAFDQDLSAATSAVGTLLRSGLVKDADEAFDVITRGFQQGADKGEDLLDTMIEYPSVLRDLGINAAEATGLLTQGLDAGARNSDVVADALKEFGIRGKDASEASAAGFELLGLNAEKMTAAVAAGGPKAKDALDQVLDTLRKTEDPVKRNAAAVALFGTKAEDLGDSLFALDVDSAVAGLGDVEGAAAKMGDTLNDNAKTKIEAFKRQALQTVSTFVADKVIPAFERMGPVIEDLGKWFQDVALPAMRDFGTWAQDNLVPIIQDLVKWVADSLVPAVTGFADKLNERIAPALKDLWAVIQRDVLPILQNLATFFVEKVLPILGDLAILILEKVIPAIADFLENIAGGIEAVGNFLTDAKEFFADLVTTVSEMPGKIKDAASGMWDGIKDAFTDAINFIIRGWNSLEFSIPGFKVGPIGYDGFTLGTPEIPELHTGGLFDPGAGKREGLALLLKGERVLSPAQTRAYDAGSPATLGGSGMNVTIERLISMKDEPTGRTIAREGRKQMYLAGLL